MEWSDGGDAFDVALHFRCNANRLCELGAAVNDTMSDYGNFGSGLEDGGGAAP